MGAIYRAQYVHLLYIFFSVLFHRGEFLQKFLSLGKQSFLLLVCQILGVPGVQRDVGTPRRAEGPHGSGEEGANNGRRRPDRCGVIADCFGGFCGNLGREVVGRYGGMGQHITSEQTVS